MAKACTGCHALPPPDILPRAAWTAKIYEMAGLMMTGVGAPAGARAAIPTDFDVEAVERYYQARAPVTLPTPVPWPAVGEHSPRFARRVLRLPGGDAHPAISNVRFLDLDGNGALQVVATDMTHGLAMRGSPAAPERGLSVIAHVAAPCHAALVDLDRDGRPDLLVADLGDVPPADHLKGSAVWLQRREDGGYRTRVLASGLPRVADVEAADFDGDGDLDLAVAAFGWRQVGSLLLLENRTRDWSQPVFVPRTLDTRTGSIHVPAVDLDRDGRPDIVTVFSQHYETVVAFLNARDGGFRPETIYTAPHPAWGSSGIDVADLDGDGDLDIVAVAYVPEPRRSDQGPPPVLPSLVWLEQVAPGRFERRTLEVGGRHVSVDAADYDHDGDVDLVVGNFLTDTDSWVEVWENLTVKK